MTKISMRVILSLFLLHVFLFASGDVDNKSISDYLSSYWAKSYSVGGLSSAKTIIKTEDGGYVVGGSSNFIDSKNSLLILKLVSDGNIAWQRVYFDENIDNLNSITQTQDGGYMLTATTDSFNKRDNDAFIIIKLSSAGDIEWQKIYGDNDYNFNLGGVTLADNTNDSLLLAGKMNKKESSKTFAFALDIDENGSLIWQKSYGGSDSDLNFKTIVALSISSSNNGYVLVGWSNSFKSESQNNSIWSMKINSKGDPIWQILYGVKDFNIEGVSVAKTTDNGNIFSASLKDSNNDNYVLVLKNDSDGVIKWIKKYETGTLLAVYSIVATSDYGYILVGTEINKSLGTSLSVIKLYDNGGVWWRKVYGLDEQGVESASYGYSIIELPNNKGYTVAGELIPDMSENKSGFWILNIQQNGFIAFNSSSFAKVINVDARETAVNNVWSLLAPVVTKNTNILSNNSTLKVKNTNAIISTQS